ncbi:MAG: membrane protein insertase YidC [Burkholderiales bacterium]|nr:membrane protein insertase YidC [Burkholderiales bacterium]
METRRMILWMIFSVSLFMLWDNYQRSIGNPTLFGMTTGSSQDASAQKKASAPGNELPSAASPASTLPGAESSQPLPVELATKRFEVTTDVMRVQIDTLGGQITQVELLNHPAVEKASEPIKLLESGKARTYVAQSGLVGVPGAPNHKTPYRLVSEQNTLKDGESQLQIVLESEAGGVRNQLKYTFKRAHYDIEISHKVANAAEVPVSPSIYVQLTRDDTAPEGESKFYSTFTGPAVYSEEGKYQKIDFPSIAKNSATFVKNADNGWLAMVQHYFVSAIIPPANVTRENYVRKLDGNLYSIGYVSSLGVVAPGASAQQSAILYLGPQSQRVLENMAPGLELVRDYGWLTIIAKPLFWLLENLFALVKNWGWAIVLLTVIVKLLFFPLSAASYKSMAKMRTLTPRLTRLREQYGDDRARLNQAMMELYKTEKINPIGGCLPVVIQIPVFLALYWVLLASVEMRNAPWLGWIQDLATPDPYFILPVIMAVSMFVQTKLNPTPPDPVQAKVMLFMPIIFSVMFLFFPSGLVLYWVVNNILSITQQWYITRAFDTSGNKA